MVKYLHLVLMDSQEIATYIAPCTKESRIYERKGSKEQQHKKKKNLCIRTCTNECLLQNMDLMYTQKHKDSATERRRTCRHSSFTWTDTSYHKVLQASPLALENGNGHGTIRG